MRRSIFFSVPFAALILISCSTSFLKYEKESELKKIEEFDEAVKIVKPTETQAPAPTPTPVEVIKEQTTTKKDVGTPPAKKGSKKSSVVPAPTPTEKPVKVFVKDQEALAVRQPDLEDSVGFQGRRPLKDPFRVGEEVVHNVHYFKVSAGELKFKVEPFAQVNGRKSYTFAMEIKTSSLFSTFYSVDDRVETLVDYEDLVPRVFLLHVKESKQLREAKMLFDTEKGQARFWEKKVTQEHGEEEKRQEWDILPFTQNVYSAVFYMRNFQWEPGKEISYRVANDKENLVFSGKALRREVLDTKLGPMKSIVIQPNIVLKGKFKPIGDNFIWISDDDRRYILRIESKIKIGTLISEVVSIQPGKP